MRESTERRLYWSVATLACILFAAFAGEILWAAIRISHDPPPAYTPIVSEPWSEDYILPGEYAHPVARYCAETGVPVWLWCRLVAYESGWNRDCHGRTGDLGLAQLNPRCLEDFRRFNDGAEVDPMDPETAIRVGTRYLAALKASYGTWREAVRRYAGNRSRAATDEIMGGVK